MPGNPQSTFVLWILLVGAFSLLSCATPRQERDQAGVAPEKPADAESSKPAGPKVPPKTSVKKGQNLTLARIMEGGACNADDRGARGLFLVYVKSSDVERIKRERGTQVFEEFEHEIESLSLQALQESIDVINFDDNPFALDLEDALQREVQQLIAKFREFVEPGIDSFESNTGLTVDVVPFSPSLGFILDNCSSSLSGSNEAPESR